MLRSLGRFRLGLGVCCSISILGSRGFRAASALATAVLHIWIARFGGSAVFLACVSIVLGCFVPSRSLCVVACVLGGALVGKRPPNAGKSTIFGGLLGLCRRPFWSISSEQFEMSFSFSQVIELC